MSINLKLDDTEQLANKLLGLSIIFWTVKGTIEEFHTFDKVSIVRISIIVINSVVAFSFMRRRKAIINAPLKTVAACFPSFIFGSIAYRFSEPASAWPIISQILFTAGAFVTTMSFMSLGKNFAIFPALRKITTRGPYKWVRHPAYFGELLLVFTFSLNGPFWSNLIFLLAAICIVIRINIEEKLLAQEHQYRVYQQNVKWKMLYGIW